MKREGRSFKTEKVAYAKVLWHMQRYHDIKCLKYKHKGKESRFILIVLHPFLGLLSTFDRLPLFIHPLFLEKLSYHVRLNHKLN